MSRTFWSLLLVMVVGFGFASSAHAGAKLVINDSSSLDLGLRIQPEAIVTQKDLDGDGSWDSYTEFRTRRARFRLGASIGKYVDGFLQTDVSGRDGQVIDAFVVVKPHQWARFYMGLNMAPASRQNLTSSGALMTIDRPGMAYKSLTWGVRSRAGFTNYSLGDLQGNDPTDAGLRVAAGGVRDDGLTVFGSGPVGDGNVSLKYYAGIYNGINASGTDNDRFTGRVQVNFMDAEPGYYNSSTYLGKKKTVGIGASYDAQNAVALTNAADPAGAGQDVDYSFVELDGFVEYPLGDGSLTVEAGWQMLDLGDAIATVGGDAVDLNNVQGSGFYAQAGYFFGERWQPWAEFEQWASDGDMDVGNYTIYRLGVSYFIEGQNANLKLGWENTSTDVPIIENTTTGNSEDSLNTFIFGMFITY